MAAAPQASHARVRLARWRLATARRACHPAAYRAGRNLLVGLALAEARQVELIAVGAHLYRREAAPVDVVARAVERAKHLIPEVPGAGTAPERVAIVEAPV